MNLPPPDPRLTDGLVMLRPFADSDVPELVEALGDPDVSRWTRMAFPYKEEYGYDWVRVSAELRLTGKGTHLAVTDAATDRLLGGIGMDLAGSVGTFGYWIRADARGRGRASAALRLLCQWAVDELGLERMQLLTIPGNTASERVAENVGFQREGLLRRYFDQRGTLVDTWMWSLLPEELV